MIGDLEIVFQANLNLGDILIFDCNHLHASPVNVENDFRLSSELRLACDVPDDHGVNYRQTFINLKNFKTLMIKQLKKVI